MSALFSIDPNVVQNATGLTLEQKAVLRGIVDTLNEAVDVSATEADLAKLAAVTASAAELNIMDGVTATGAELTRATDVSTRVVTITATGNITEALHEGKTCLLAEVGGDAAVTLTLPAATGGGGRYRFVVDVVNTSGYIIKAVSGADVFNGSVLGNDGAAVTTAWRWHAAATDDTLTLDGTTTGGVFRGDWVEFEDVSATGWAVRGAISQSGAEATPFSDTVA